MTLVHCLDCAELIPPDLDVCPSCHARQDTAHLSFADPGTVWESVESRLRTATADKYELQGLLGYGGMAAVFLAHDAKLDRRVAIKVMSPALMAERSMVERFMTEATATARLRHPNIVTIFDVDEREGLHYFVMSYVAGRPLDSLIREEGTLAVDVTRYWIAQIAEALAYAHGKGVVHRDIKPGNILLDEDGQALVADFGIAKVAGQEGLTRYGAVIGTPAYISPEQYREDRASPRSDQYALGVVAYEMLAGVPPIRGSAHAITAAHVVGTDPRPLREVRPDCPEELAEAIHRMLSRDPSKRWPSLHDLVLALGTGPVDRADPLFASVKGLVRGREVASLDVSALPDVLVEGEERELRVRAMDRTGAVIQGRGVMVRTTDRSVLAVSPGGKVRAHRPGTVDLVARSGSASVAMPLQVIAAPVQSVSVSPKEATFPPGGPARFEARVIGPEGRALEGRTVSWRVSEPDVAAIGHDGVVEALAEGSTEVIASCDGVEGTARLTVPASSLEARPTEPRRAPTAGDAAPHPSAADESDGSAADRTMLIESTGRADEPPRISRRAPSAGPRTETTARTSRPGRRRWTFMVVVLAVGTAAVGWPLVRGGSQRTSAAREDSPASSSTRGEGPSEPDPDPTTTSPSAQTSPAVVEPGQAPPPVPSDEVVERTADQAEEADAGTTSSVARVVVSVADDTVRVGDRLSLRAAATTADGGSIDAEPRWHVSDPTLARVERSDAGPVLVGVAAGWVRVEAEVEGVTGAAVVHVVERVTELRISPGDATIRPGDTMRIEVSDQAGRILPGSFRSSDPDVATVSADGLLEARAPGTVTVAVSAGGVDAETEYVVEGVEAPPSDEAEAPADMMETMVDPERTYGPREITERPVLLNEDEYVRAVNDRYPRLLRDVGVGGTVRLELTIARDGTVLEARIVEPGANREALESAAVEIGRLLEFRPAKRFGEDVATSGFEFAVRFDPGH